MQQNESKKIYIILLTYFYFDKLFIKYLQLSLFCAGVKIY